MRRSRACLVCVQSRRHVHNSIGDSVDKRFLLSLPPKLLLLLSLVVGRKMRGQCQLTDQPTIGWERSGSSKCGLEGRVEGKSFSSVLLFQRWKPGVWEQVHIHDICWTCWWSMTTSSLHLDFCSHFFFRSCLCSALFHLCCHFHFFLVKPIFRRFEPILPILAEFWPISVNSSKIKLILPIMTESLITPFEEPVPH